MRIHPFRAELPNLALVKDETHFFTNVKSKYLKFKKNGLFETTDEAAVFLYQIEHPNGRIYNGIVASTDVQHYLDKKIKGHEATITTKEKQQMKLLEKREAQVKPILLTYRAVDVIDAWMAQHTYRRPNMEIKQEEGIHRIWRITNVVEIQILSDFFKQYVKTSYIADGHHRSACAARLYQKIPDCGRIMAAFFSFQQLDILDYNRVIEHADMSKLMTHLEEIFEVKKLPEAKKPKQKFCLSLYYQKQWYSLKWKASLMKQINSVLLDAALLNEYVFEALFAIEDIKTAPNIEYTGGAAGAKGIEKLVDAAPNRAGFWMYPVGISDLAAIVDLDEVLPPKSTWFEPRMLNGLTIFNIIRQ